MVPPHVLHVLIHATKGDCTASGVTGAVSPSDLSPLYRPAIAPVNTYTYTCSKPVTYNRFVKSAVSLANEM